MRIVFALTGGPSAEPVSAADLRGYARLDDNGDGALIDGFIATARHMVEQHTGRSLLSQTWTARFETWPEPGEDGRIRVRLSPFPTAISSVTVDGVALSSALYTLLGDEVVFDIDLDDAPEGDDVTDGVLITFTTLAAQTTPPLLLVIKMLAAHFYEHREPVSLEQLSGVPGLAHILAQYRVMRELN